MNTYNFITADLTVISQSIAIRAVNYPVPYGNGFLAGDIVTSSNAPFSASLIPDIYEFECSNQSLSEWYVNISGSTVSIVSGSAISSSVSTVTFRPLDSFGNPMVNTTISIEPLWKNVLFNSGSYNNYFIATDTLTHTTDATGSLVIDLIPMPYEVVVYGNIKNPKFKILPTGTSCNAKDSFSHSSHVSPTVTPQNQANVGFTALSSDLRYIRSNGSGSAVSASYAQSASYAPSTPISSVASASWASSSLSASYVKNAVSASYINGKGGILTLDALFTPNVYTSIVNVNHDLSNDLTLNGATYVVGTLHVDSVILDPSNETSIDTNNRILSGLWNAETLTNTNGDLIVQASEGGNLILRQTVNDGCSITFDTAIGQMRFDAANDIKFDANIDCTTSINSPAYLQNGAIFVPTNAKTASFVTASNVRGTVNSASYSVSASYAPQATINSVPSASWVSASVRITNADTASFITASNVNGYVANALNANTASLARTASYITASNIFGTVANAKTASYINGHGNIDGFLLYGNGGDTINFKRGNNSYPAAAAVFLDGDGNRLGGFSMDANYGNFMYVPDSNPNLLVLDSDNTPQNIFCGKLKVNPSFDSTPSSYQFTVMGESDFQGSIGSSVGAMQVATDMSQVNTVWSIGDVDGTGNGNTLTFDRVTGINTLSGVSNAINGTTVVNSPFYPNGGIYNAAQDIVAISVTDDHILCDVGGATIINFSGNGTPVSIESATIIAGNLQINGASSAVSSSGIIATKLMQMPYSASNKALTLNPQTGSMYVNVANKFLYVYSGTAWMSSSMA